MLWKITAVNNLRAYANLLSEFWRIFFFKFWNVNQCSSIYKRFLLNQKVHIDLFFPLVVLHTNLSKVAISCLCLYLLCLTELFQADVDEFCQYYGRRGAGLCFPDFQRRQLLGQDSNYLEDEKIDEINRFVSRLAVVWNISMLPYWLFGFTF